MKEFFKNAFNDMKENAKAQHEVDKANFDAVKAESKANWEEAKAMGRTDTMKKIMQQQREEQIADAKARTQAAQQRIDNAKDNK